MLMQAEYKEPTRRGRLLEEKTICDAISTLLIDLETAKSSSYLTFSTSMWAAPAVSDWLDWSESVKTG